MSKGDDQDKAGPRLTGVVKVSGAPGAIHIAEVPSAIFVKNPPCHVVWINNHLHPKKLRLLHAYHKLWFLTYHQTGNQLSPVTTLV